jgi:hypothetical protein
MANRITFSVIGLIAAAIGALWILQGFDLLGQNGGMNGKTTWSWIGFVALIVGLGVLYAANRPRRRM